MYLFLQPSEDLAKELRKKMKKLSSFQTTSNQMIRWRKAYDRFYGRVYMSHGGEEAGKSGEQSEYSTITINHARNLVLHIMSLITQNKMVFDAQASNSDIESRNASIVTNAVLDHFFYEKRFERQCKQVLEMSLVFGTAFLHPRWNTGQKFVGVDGEGNPVFAGAPEFVALSPLDVLIEPFKQDFKDQNYVVIRELVNKYDLMAEHPEFRDKIEALPRIADLQNFLPFWQVENDHVWRYTAYHKSTPSLINGRMTVFCDNDLVLSDAENPYTDYDGVAHLPIMCMRPSIMYGTAYGHTPFYDLMPIQQAMDILDSTILTNQEAFGVQNVTAARGSGVQASQLTGALNLVEYDVVEGAPNAGRPEAMNLCATPPEIFRQREQYKTDMEMLSGINSAARGAPAQQLVSGTAIALVAAQSQQFNSALESNYVSVIEEAANFLVCVLSKFMATEEVISIAGKFNTYASGKFTGDDMSGIRRVKITIGNPLGRTQAGRLEIANNLMQGQLITNPADYIEVLQTGSITPILEHGTAQEGYIRLENDQLAKGEKPIMVALDNHDLHIREHTVLLFRPDVRANSAIVSNILAHIQEHSEQLEQMAISNPMFLSIALGQPLQLPVPDPRTGVGPGAQALTDGSVPPPALPEGQQGAQTAEAATGAGGTQAVAESGQRRAENVAEQAAQQVQG